MAVVVAVRIVRHRVDKMSDILNMRRPKMKDMKQRKAEASRWADIPRSMHSVNEKDKSPNIGRYLRT